MVVVSSNFSAPVEGVLFQAPSTKLVVNDQEIGTGTLYITESNVVWGDGVRPSGTPASTISLLYPTISLHAVQREPSAALFMVLNYDLSLPELAPAAAPPSGNADPNAEDEDDEFDPEDQPITQLRFIPTNENDLQAMYSAMSVGQSLHPDPADEVDEEGPYMDGEDDGGDEEFEDAEESGAGGAGGAGDEAAARLRNMRLEHSNGNSNHDEMDDADIGDE